MLTNTIILADAVDFAPAFSDAIATGSAVLPLGLGLLGLVVAIHYGISVLRALGVVGLKPETDGTTAAERDHDRDRD
jgi:hypothetical protein